MKEGHSPPRPGDRPWFISTRLEQYQAEGQINFLRILAVLVFYAIELIRHYGLPLAVLELPASDPENNPFHWSATCLVTAWVCLAALVAWMLNERFFPPWLPYAATAVDVLLLTTLLTLGEGPKSPLLPAYFVVLALAAGRLQRGVLWFTAAGSAAGYLFLLAYARFLAPERDLRVPRFHQLLFLAALTLTAVVLDHLVSRVPHLAGDYARRRSVGKEAIP